MKKLVLFALMGTAAALTNCSKDETQEVLDTMIAPKITLTFDKDKVEAKGAKLIIRKPSYNDSEKEAFVDLNGNLRKDDGEGFEINKTYIVTTERVSIVGEGIEELHFDSQNLLKAEVTHRYIKKLTSDDVSLKSVVISNAQSLEELDVSSTDDDYHLAELLLPEEKQKIANLKELNLARCTDLNRADVFNRLPDRTGKDPKGKVKFLAYEGALTGEEEKILINLNWEAIFGNEP